MAALKTNIQETLCGSQQVIFGNANLYMFVIPIREKRGQGLEGELGGVGI